MKSRYDVVFNMSDVGHGKVALEKIIEVAKIAFGRLIHKIDGL